jgi:hypothetical protein
MYKKILVIDDEPERAHRLGSYSAEERKNGRPS